MMLFKQQQQQQNKPTQNPTCSASIFLEEGGNNPLHDLQIHYKGLLFQNLPLGSAFIVFP